MIEYFIKILRPKHMMSLGIMQVQTNVWINNRMSIALAIAKLYAVFSASDNDCKLANAIQDYNTSDRYSEQVGTIYEELCQYLNLGQLGYHRVKVHHCNLVMHK